MAVDIGTIISQWQGAGIYEYLLPFLLVFAIVFGILSAINIFGRNKGVNLIIAIVIGLMAIGYNYSSGLFLSDFLRELFPRLGIGLAVMLSLLILVGIFIPSDERRYWMYGLGTIGVVVFIIIIMQAFERYGWAPLSYGDYVGWIIFGVLLIGVIIAVSVSSGESERRKEGQPDAFVMPWYKHNK